VARWLPQPTGAALPALPVATGLEWNGDAGPLPVYDAAMLPRLLGDDPQVLAEVRNEFVLSATSTARALRAAVANGECATVESLAHRQKSSARAIGAIAFGECCARLEQAGAAGHGAEVDSILVEFDAALAALLSAMNGDAPTPAVPQKSPPVAAIVVVDDEPLQLDLIQRQLQFQGAPVFAYSSASAALASLENRDTSALLLLFDMNMPGMDGVELMRQLAERRYEGTIGLISGADTRVLETASKLAQAYNLSVLNYLQKPVMPAALRDVVDRWRNFIPRHSQRESKTYGVLEIRQGIDDDQFFLQYQPKVSLEDGSLVGVEALLRWNHPTDGFLYPDRFIEVAESHDLIDDLTYVVLEKAVAQARQWRDAGLDLRVAVNISMRSLSKLDFPVRVLELVERHGIKPDDLMLEVTESTLMSDARAPLSTLTRLRLHAVGLSIDDFGTGHSSLAQLRDIPFDELKIDRGFVHDVGRQPTQQAIFLASLNMAHQLNMKVVAEGVEDAADWDYVRDAGCDVAQGYFISRPLDAASVAGWAEVWAVRYREGNHVPH
jgi:EAL domain-containing protein (putative c-di-GMP-specific phosphodiesterase class I)/FixJ family two-component response regulator